MQGALERALEPVILALHPVLDAFADWIDRNQGLVAGLIVLGTVFAVLVPIVWGLSKAVAAVVGAVGALAFFLTPVGALVGGIILAAAAVYLLFTRVELVRDAILTMVNAVAGAISAVVRWIVRLLNFVIGGFNAIPRLPGADFAIPTLRAPRLDAFEGGFFDLRPHEQDLLNAPARAVGGVFNITTNNFGLSLEEVQRSAEAEISTAQARARLAGY